MQEALSLVGSILQCVSPPSVLVHNVVIWQRGSSLSNFVILFFASLIIGLQLWMDCHFVSLGAKCQMLINHSYCYDMTHANSGHFVTSFTPNWLG